MSPWLLDLSVRLRGWAERTLVYRCLRRYLEINGSVQALAIAGHAFTAFIPLLIVIASVVPHDGGSPIGDQIVSRMHLSGDGAAAVTTLFARPPDAAGALTILGVLFLVVSSLSMAKGLQRAYESAWDMPPGRRRTINGAAALTVLLTQVLLLSLLASLLHHAPGGSVLTFVLRAAIDVPMWLVFQRLLLGGRVAWRLLVPGAITTSIGQQVVMLYSAIWMPYLIERNAQRYGVIGVTFALLSWLTIVSVILVGAAVVSAELGERDVHAAEVVT